MRNKEFYKTFAWELARTNSGQLAYLNAAKETAITPGDKIKASQKSHNLLRNPLVKKYLQQIRDDQRIGVTEIVDELAQIIRFDPIDMLNSDGTVKPIHDMPEAARKMIAGLEVSEIWMGRGKDREQFGVVKKIKFLSKMDAIEKAMKHLGGYKEDNDQKKAVTQIAIFQLPDNDRDNTRLNDTSKLIEIEIGQPMEDQQPEPDPGSSETGTRPALFSSVGKIDKVNRKKVTTEPAKQSPEAGATQSPEAGRGTRVQGKPGTGVGVKPDIQTEFGPGD